MIGKTKSIECEIKKLNLIFYVDFYHSIRLAASTTLMFLPCQLCSYIDLFFLFKKKKSNLFHFMLKTGFCMTHLVILLFVVLILLNMKLKGSAMGIMGLQHVKALFKFNLRMKSSTLLASSMQGNKWKKKVVVKLEREKGSLFSPDFFFFVGYPCSWSTAKTL